VNLGDGLLGVHVRMKGGMTVCRVTVLKEGKKPKVNDDDFYLSEDIWYASTVIGQLQKLRIEELKGGSC
jgi:hypothetical protein